jgi:hypothetical protein
MTTAWIPRIRPPCGPTESEASADGALGGVCPTLDVRVKQVCSRPASSDPSAVPPATVRCTGHDQCGDGEFCGAGYCREIATESGTLCMHAALFEGPILGVFPPWAYAELLDYYGGAPTIGTECVEGCAPIWNQCAVTPLLHDRMATILTGSPIFPWDGSESRLLPPLGSSVDGGCLELLTPARGRGVDDLAWVRHWYSVWYP